MANNQKRPKTIRNLLTKLDVDDPRTYFDEELALAYQNEIWYLNGELSSNVHEVQRNIPQSSSATKPPVATFVETIYERNAASYFDEDVAEWYQNEMWFQKGCQTVCRSQISEEKDQSLENVETLAKKNVYGKKVVEPIRKSSQISAAESQIAIINYDHETPVKNLESETIKIPSKAGQKDRTGSAEIRKISLKSGSRITIKDSGYNSTVMPSEMTPKSERGSTPASNGEIERNAPTNQRPSIGISKAPPVEDLIPIEIPKSQDSTTEKGPQNLPGKRLSSPQETEKVPSKSQVSPLGPQDVSPSGDGNKTLLEDQKSSILKKSPAAEPQVASEPEESPLKSQDKTPSRVETRKSLVKAKKSSIMKKSSLAEPQISSESEKPPLKEGTPSRIGTRKSLVEAKKSSILKKSSLAEPQISSESEEPPLKEGTPSEIGTKKSLGEAKKSSILKKSSLAEPQISSESEEPPLKEGTPSEIGTKKLLGEAKKSSILKKSSLAEPQISSESEEPPLKEGTSSEIGTKKSLGEAKKLSILKKSSLAERQIPSESEESPLKSQYGIPSGIGTRKSLGEAKKSSILKKSSLAEPQISSETEEPLLKEGTPSRIGTRKSLVEGKKSSNFNKSSLVEPQVPSESEEQTLKAQKRTPSGTGTRKSLLVATKSSIIKKSSLADPQTPIEPEETSPNSQKETPSGIGTKKSLLEAEKSSILKKSPPADSQITSESEEPPLKSQDEAPSEIGTKKSIPEAHSVNLQKIDKVPSESEVSPLRPQDVAPFDDSSILKKSAAANPQTPSESEGPPLKSEDRTSGIETRKSLLETKKSSFYAKSPEKTVSGIKKVSSKSSQKKIVEKSFTNSAGAEGRKVPKANLSKSNLVLAENELPNIINDMEIPINSEGAPLRSQDSTASTKKIPSATGAKELIQPAGKVLGSSRSMLKSSKEKAPAISASNLEGLQEMPSSSKSRVKKSSQTAAKVPSISKTLAKEKASTVSSPNLGGLHEVSAVSSKETLESVRPGLELVSKRSVADLTKTEGPQEVSENSSLKVDAEKTGISPKRSIGSEDRCSANLAAEKIANLGEDIRSIENECAANAAFTVEPTAILSEKELIAPINTGKTKGQPETDKECAANLSMKSGGSKGSGKKEAKSTPTPSEKLGIVTSLSKASEGDTGNVPERPSSGKKIPGKTVSKKSASSLPKLRSKVGEDGTKLSPKSAEFSRDAPRAPQINVEYPSPEIKGVELEAAAGEMLPRKSATGSSTPAETLVPEKKVSKKSGTSLKLPSKLESTELAEISVPEKKISKKSGISLKLPSKVDSPEPAEILVPERKILKKSGTTLKLPSKVDSSESAEILVPEKKISKKSGTSLKLPSKEESSKSVEFSREAPRTPENILESPSPDIKSAKLFISEERLPERSIPSVSVTEISGSTTSQGTETISIPCYEKEASEIPSKRSKSSAIVPGQNEAILGSPENLLVSEPTRKLTGDIIIKPKSLTILMEPAGKVPESSETSSTPVTDAESGSIVSRLTGDMVIKPESVTIILEPRKSLQGKSGSRKSLPLETGEKTVRLTGDIVIKPEGVTVRYEPVKSGSKQMVTEEPSELQPGHPIEISEAEPDTKVLFERKSLIKSSKEGSKHGKIPKRISVTTSVKSNASAESTKKPVRSKIGKSKDSLAPTVGVTKSGPILGPFGKDAEISEGHPEVEAITTGESIPIDSDFVLEQKISVTTDAEIPGLFPEPAEPIRKVTRSIPSVLSDNEIRTEISTPPQGDQVARRLSAEVSVKGSHLSITSAKSMPASEEAEPIKKVPGSIPSLLKGYEVVSEKKTVTKTPKGVEETVTLELAPKETPSIPRAEPIKKAPRSIPSLLPDYRVVTETKTVIKTPEGVEETVTLELAAKETPDVPASLLSDHQDLPEIQVAPTGDEVGRRFSAEVTTKGSHPSIASTMSIPSPQVAEPIKKVPRSIPNLLKGYEVVSEKKTVTKTPEGVEETVTLKLTPKEISSIPSTEPIKKAPRSIPSLLPDYRVVTETKTVTKTPEGVEETVTLELASKDTPTDPDGGPIKKVPRSIPSLLTDQGYQVVSKTQKTVKTPSGKVEQTVTVELAPKKIPRSIPSLLSDYKIVTETQVSTPPGEVLEQTLQTELTTKESRLSAGSRSIPGLTSDDEARPSVTAQLSMPGLVPGEQILVEQTIPGGEDGTKGSPSHPIVKIRRTIPSLLVDYETPKAVSPEADLPGGTVIVERRLSAEMKKKPVPDKSQILVEKKLTGEVKMKKSPPGVELADGTRSAERLSVKAQLPGPLPGEQIIIEPTAAEGVGSQASIKVRRTIPSLLSDEYLPGEKEPNLGRKISAEIITKEIHSKSQKSILEEVQIGPSIDLSIADDSQQISTHVPSRGSLSITLKEEEKATKAGPKAPSGVPVVSTPIQSPKVSIGKVLEVSPKAEIVQDVDKSPSLEVEASQKESPKSKSRSSKGSIQELEPEDKDVGRSDSRKSVSFGEPKESKKGILSRFSFSRKRPSTERRSSILKDSSKSTVTPTVESSKGPDPKVTIMVSPEKKIVVSTESSRFEEKAIRIVPKSEHEASRADVSGSDKVSQKSSVQKKETIHKIPSKVDKSAEILPKKKESSIPKKLEGIPPKSPGKDQKRSKPSTEKPPLQKISPKESPDKIKRKSILKDSSSRSSKSKASTASLIPELDKMGFPLKTSPLKRTSSVMHIRSNLVEPILDKMGFPTESPKRGSTKSSESTHSVPKVDPMGFPVFAKTSEEASKRPSEAEEEPVKVESEELIPGMVSEAKEIPKTDDEEPVKTKLPSIRLSRTLGTPIISEEKYIGDKSGSISGSTESSLIQEKIVGAAKKSTEGVIGREAQNFISTEIASGTWKKTAGTPVPEPSKGTQVELAPTEVGIGKRKLVFGKESQDKKKPESPLIQETKKGAKKSTEGGIGTPPKMDQSEAENFISTEIAYGTWKKTAGAPVAEVKKYRDKKRSVVPPESTAEKSTISEPEGALIFDREGAPGISAGGPRSAEPPIGTTEILSGKLPSKSAEKTISTSVPGRLSGTFGRKISSAPTEVTSRGEADILSTITERSELVQTDITIPTDIIIRPSKITAIGGSLTDMEIDIRESPGKAVEDKIPPEKAGPEKPQKEPSKTPVVFPGPEPDGARPKAGKKAPKAAKEPKSKKGKKETPKVPISSDGTTPALEAPVAGPVPGDVAVPPITGTAEKTAIVELPKEISTPSEPVSLEPSEIIPDKEIHVSEIIIKDVEDLQVKKKGPKRSKSPKKGSPVFDQRPGTDPLVDVDSKATLVSGEKSPELDSLQKELALEKGRESPSKSRKGSPEFGDLEKAEKDSEKLFLRDVLARGKPVVLGTEDRVTCCSHSGKPKSREKDLKKVSPTKVEKIGRESPEIPETKHPSKISVPEETVPKSAEVTPAGEGEKVPLKTEKIPEKRFGLGKKKKESPISQQVPTKPEAGLRITKGEVGTEAQVAPYKTGVESTDISVADQVPVIDHPSKTVLEEGPITSPKPAEISLPGKVEVPTKKTSSILLRDVLAQEKPVVLGTEDRVTCCSLSGKLKSREKDLKKVSPTKVEKIGRESPEIPGTKHPSKISVLEETLPKSAEFTPAGEGQRATPKTEKIPEKKFGLGRKKKEPPIPQKVTKPEAGPEIGTEAQVAPIKTGLESTDISVAGQVSAIDHPSKTVLEAGPITPPKPVEVSLPGKVEVPTKKEKTSGGRFGLGKKKAPPETPPEKAPIKPEVGLKTSKEIFPAVGGQLPPPTVSSEISEIEKVSDISSQLEEKAVLEDGPKISGEGEKVPSKKEKKFGLGKKKEAKPQKIPVTKPEVKGLSRIAEKGQLAPAPEADPSQKVSEIPIQLELTKPKLGETSSTESGPSVVEERGRLPPKQAISDHSISAAVGPIGKIKKPKIKKKKEKKPIPHDVDEIDQKSFFQGEEFIPEGKPPEATLEKPAKVEITSSKIPKVYNKGSPTKRPDLEKGDTKIQKVPSAESGPSAVESPNLLTPKTSIPSVVSIKPKKGLKGIRAKKSSEMYPKKSLDENLLPSGDKTSPKIVEEPIRRSFAGRPSHEEPPLPTDFIRRASGPKRDLSPADVSEIEEQIIRSHDLEFPELSTDGQSATVSFRTSGTKSPRRTVNEPLFVEIQNKPSIGDPEIFSAKNVAKDYKKETETYRPASELEYPEKEDISLGPDIDLKTPQVKLEPRIQTSPSKTSGASAVQNVLQKPPLESDDESFKSARSDLSSIETGSVGTPRAVLQKDLPVPIAEPKIEATSPKLEVVSPSDRTIFEKPKKGKPKITPGVVTPKSPESTSPELSIVSSGSPKSSRFGKKRPKSPEKEPDLEIYVPEVKVKAKSIDLGKKGKLPKASGKVKEPAIQMDPAYSRFIENEALGEPVTKSPGSPKSSRKRPSKKSPEPETLEVYVPEVMVKAKSFDLDAEKPKPPVVEADLPKPEVTPRRGISSPKSKKRPEKTPEKADLEIFVPEVKVRAKSIDLGVEKPEVDLPKSSEESSRSIGSPKIRKGISKKPAESDNVDIYVPEIKVETKDLDLGKKRPKSKGKGRKREEKDPSKPLEVDPGELKSEEPSSPERVEIFVPEVFVKAKSVDLGKKGKPKASGKVKEPAIQLDPSFSRFIENEALGEPKSPGFTPKKGPKGTKKDPDIKVELPEPTIEGPKDLEIEKPSGKAPEKVEIFVPEVIVKPKKVDTGKKGRKGLKKEPSTPLEEGSARLGTPTPSGKSPGAENLEIFVPEVYVKAKSVDFGATKSPKVSLSKGKFFNFFS